MARIPEDATASTIQQCVQNAQAAVCTSYDQNKRIQNVEDGITNLGDAIIALTNQVKLLNEGVRNLDDRHVSLLVKTRSKIRIWME